jgi:hypothetical protein
MRTYRDLFIKDLFFLQDLFLQDLFIKDILDFINCIKIQGTHIVDKIPKEKIIPSPSLETFDFEIVLSGTEASLFTG